MVMKCHSPEHMVKRLRVSIFVYQVESKNKENLVNYGNSINVHIVKFHKSHKLHSQNYYRFVLDSMIYLSIFFITGPTDNGNMGSCKWNKMQPTFLGVFLMEQQYPTVI
jgi:hypothetical protein